MNISLDETVSHSMFGEETVMTKRLMRKVESNYEMKTSENPYACVNTLYGGEWLLGCHLSNRVRDFEQLKTAVFSSRYDFAEGIRHFSKLKSSNLLDLETSKSKSSEFLCASNDVRNPSDLRYMKNHALSMTSEYNVVFFDDYMPLRSAYMAMSLLGEKCVFVAKVQNPEHWGNSWRNYLLLYSLVFNHTELMRFPICTYGKARYDYYVVGVDRTMSIHDERTIKTLYSTIKKGQTAIDLFKVNLHDTSEWHEKLAAAKKRIVAGNPLEDTYEYMSEIFV